MQFQPLEYQRMEKSEKDKSYMFLLRGVPWSYRGWTVERLDFRVETLDFAVVRPWFATPQKPVKIC